MTAPTSKRRSRRSRNAAAKAQSETRFRILEEDHDQIETSATVQAQTVPKGNEENEEEEDEDAGEEEHEEDTADDQSISPNSDGPHTFRQLVQDYVAAIPQARPQFSNMKAGDDTPRTPSRAQAQVRVIHEDHVNDEQSTSSSYDDDPPTFQELVQDYENDGKYILRAR